MIQVLSAYCGYHSFIINSSGLASECLQNIAVVIDIHNIHIGLEWGDYSYKIS